ncbi:alcohol dehydrogenase catalytic domain-containing protein [Candidatus Agathobaculum pullicola]|uniref:mannitol dehydrogenase family protein n=1 Tax=Candidatus Agathobaculum pullicola TaxID=2838426 RepID=UPI003F8E01D5
MKAICIKEPGKVEIVEREMPVRGPGEALLKLLYGGICGSDLGSYRGANAYVSYPRVPGHEFSAEIIEIDENDKGLKPGMVVTCNPYFNCGSCYSCKRGLVNACTDNQTKELEKCVGQYIEQWGLEADFKAFCGECTFCSTLVDRIVPGRIKDADEAARMDEENGYHDELIDVGEVFGVWNIEGPAWLEDKLPFKAAGLNCIVVPDVTPYKKRKVRILNGAHTGFVLGAYLAGFDIVRDCMHNEHIKGFMNKMLHEEVIPTLPLDKNDLEDFAAAVEDRFNNPFVDHELMSISLNSTSKWKARNMPSFLEYIEKQGKLPVCLTMSLAAYIAFYSTDVQELTDKGLVCKRAKGNTYTCSDDRWALEFYWVHRDDSDADLVRAVLTNEQMWDRDLTKIDGLEAAVLADLTKIRTEGAEAAFASCL